MSQEMRNSFMEAYNNEGGEGHFEPDDVPPTVEEVQPVASTQTDVLAMANQYEAAPLALAAVIITLLVSNLTARKLTWKVSGGLLKVITPTAANHDSHLSTIFKGIVWVLVVIGLSILPFVLL